MAEIMRDWASLDLVAVLLWAMWIEYRMLRRGGRQR